MSSWLGTAHFWAPPCVTSNMAINLRLKCQCVEVCDAKKNDDLTREVKDQALFEAIGDEYAKKDFHFSTKIY